MKYKMCSLILCCFAALSLHATSLRVEMVDLSKNPSKYKILDVRSSDAYNKDHINGALSFPVNLTYDNLKINGKIANPNKLQKVFRSLGLSVGDPIVVYDDGVFFDASRVFWTLEVYGFTNVKLINGGYDQWVEQKLPLSNKIPSVKESDYIASINYKHLATKFTTQIATKTTSHIIVDARNTKAYVGKASTAKRFGHIPKAINIPASHNIDTATPTSTSQLKGIENLKDLYKGLDINKRVIIYCAVGRIASTNYFALRELGYNVANYDSSWKEWGNDFNLPIRNRSKE